MKGKLLIFACLISSHLIAQNLKEKPDIQTINLDKYFESFEGSFVLLNLNTNKTIIYKDSISTVRYSPCSTFKIAN